MLAGMFFIYYENLSEFQYINIMIILLLTLHVAIAFVNIEQKQFYRFLSDHSPENIITFFIGKNKRTILS